MKNLTLNHVFWCLAMLTLFSFNSYGKKPTIEKVEPSNWWVGMKNKQVELLVYGENISSTEVKLSYENVSIEKITKGNSPNYLFIELNINPNAKPGNLPLEFYYTSKKKITYQYQLKERKKSNNTQQGVHAGDVMYLIMPDRFANGNPENDDVKGMLEKANRVDPSGKHGGDIEGIKQNLDYIQKLGVTTIWLNPVFENNMDSYSYHGYSITDFYKLDPRLGSNEEYEQLVNEAHNKGLKVVMDMVFNHCGFNHWWMKDLPFKDWINQQEMYEAHPDAVEENYMKTNYIGSTVSDPYVSDHDINRMVDGWFVPTMPDLNQKNPHMAKYLIQNSIWWIESSGLDGIRMDTYPYPNKEMMATWVKSVLNEYPKFYIVGETWLHSPAMEAYWLSGNTLNTGFESNLKSISDFPMHYAITSAFKKGEKQEEDGSLTSLYEVLAQDLLYDNPFNNKIFLDNHDVERFYYQIGEDFNKYKMAMAFLFTTRGIPQFYYGTELAMTMDSVGNDGFKRVDFPGGWDGDSKNAFIQTNLTTLETEALTFSSKLLNWRKHSIPIQEGKLKHFAVENELYLFARYTNNESNVTILNNSYESIKIDYNRFQEVFKGYGTAKDIISGKTFNDLKNIEIPAQTAFILELK